MSLDVILISDVPVRSSGTGVFVRQGGATVQLSPEEVLLRWPGAHIHNQTKETNRVYRGNITHNLGKMAAECDLYYCCWRPEELGLTKASQLVPLLKKGLDLLIADPDKYKQFNPENGWGNYECLVDFVKKYLEACIQNPDAQVVADR